MRPRSPTRARSRRLTCRARSGSSTASGGRSRTERRGAGSAAGWTRLRCRKRFQSKRRRYMERFCFMFELRPGMEDEYKRRHDEIWPELVEAIKAAGISNYTLFRRERQVIAYCECEPDAATAFAKVGATDVNRRWSEWFEDTIEALTDKDGNLF